MQERNWNGYNNNYDNQEDFGYDCGKEKEYDNYDCKEEKDYGCCNKKCYCKEQKVERPKCYQQTCCFEKCYCTKYCWPKFYCKHDHKKCH